jgi:hypothetical protein
MAPWWVPRWRRSFPWSADVPGCLGQAFNNELILVHIYSAHFRRLDFVPVWSSSDGVGLGSPILLSYQKGDFLWVGVPSSSA